jgi:hypothetical protein
MVGRTFDRKTILIQTEQGFGDSFQFLRYVPIVAEGRAKVVLAVPEPLPASPKLFRVSARWCQRATRYRSLTFIVAYSAHPVS